MSSLTIDLDAVRNHDLTEILDRLTAPWAKQHVMAEMGEHYKLLSYLADLHTDSLMLDLGTAEGTSALAMAAHAAERNNTVITVDVEERLLWRIDGFPIEAYRACATSRLVRCLAPLTALIFLDIDHLGIRERILYENLVALDWKGLLVIDDIAGTGLLREVWESIEIPKWDLTGFCHWSGTGLVDFRGDAVVIASGHRVKTCDATITMD